MNSDLGEQLSKLSTPHLADACLRVGVSVRCGPAGMNPLVRGMRCAGRALPVRHVGSVDIFLEALEHAQPGDILVIDNGGRLDEACVGDLITLEVQKAGLQGIVIWGLHRDTDELLSIGLPLFSLGSMPNAPQRLDSRPVDSIGSAQVGPWKVTSQDFAVCDSDGVLFIAEANIKEIVDAATTIRQAELKQADKMRSGISFRKQTRFAEYLSARTANPALQFREHRRKLGRASED